MIAASDRSGNIVKEFSYDAWGRRRSTDNWTNYSVTLDTLGTGGTQLFTRGFCFHEHLDVFGLINMNGRMYDPRLGRFLSPDNYVQAPDNSQSYNRYSYCMNNPLKYIDPSGYTWWSHFKGLDGRYRQEDCICSRFYSRRSCRNYGCYPTDTNGNGAYDMSELLGSNGEMHIDNPITFSARYKGNVIDSYTLLASPSQEQTLINVLGRYSANPGVYSLSGRNCTTVAESVLKAVGVIDKAANVSNSYGIVSPASFGAYLSTIYYPNTFTVK